MYKQHQQVDRDFFVDKLTQRVPGPRVQNGVSLWVVDLGNCCFCHKRRLHTKWRDYFYYMIPTLQGAGRSGGFVWAF